MQEVNDHADLGRRIVFLFGAARSGTTFLNGFLFRWFGVGTGPEGQFVPEFYSRLRQYGDLAQHQNLDRLVADISRTEMLKIIRDKWPEDISFDVTPAMISEHVAEPNYASVVYAVFKCVALGQNCDVVGNKYPAYWRHLDLLDELFGDDARYVAIIRDGRDVAMSTMRTPWGESNTYACAVSWRKCLQAISAFKATPRAHQLLVLRYEDLLTTPRDVVNLLAEHLELELPESTRDKAVADAEEGLSRHPVAKWKQEMADDDCRIFEAVAGNELSAFDYERRFPGAHVSSVESLRFTTSEFVSKLRRNVEVRLKGG